MSKTAKSSLLEVELILHGAHSEIVVCARKCVSYRHHLFLERLAVNIFCSSRECIRVAEASEINI
jgi:hypothetical protein